MTRPALPPVSALEARLGVPVGSLVDEDLARAVAALEDAEALVVAEAPPAVAAVWATEAPRVVSLVALKAARREYENAQGYSTESLGEHTVGLSETSGVYLTGREIGQLRRAARGGGPAYPLTVRTPSAYETKD